LVYPKATKRFRRPSMPLISATPSSAAWNSARVTSPSRLRSNSSKLMRASRKVARPEPRNMAPHSCGPIFWFTFRSNTRKASAKQVCLPRSLRRNFRSEKLHSSVKGATGPRRGAENSRVSFLFTSCSMELILLTRKAAFFIRVNTRVWFSLGFSVESQTSLTMEDSYLVCPTTSLSLVLVPATSGVT